MAALPTKANPAIKSIGAELDWTENWTNWLNEDDPIVEFDAIPNPDGTLEVSRLANDGAKVTAFIAGGVLKAKDSVLYKIETLAGRKDERTIYFKIEQR